MQRYSKLFIKTKKSAKEFDSKNASLLIKAGFIHQTMAGVYTFLPLGLRVLNKIENIVREEMNKIGVELYISSLSPNELWEQTGRINDVDVLMKTTAANKASLSKSTNEYILNSTHEELITPIAQENNISYKDFPFAFYQIQTKFRNEARAKSGLLRGREFRMKDLYSFHSSVEDFREYYKKSKEIYMNVFNRVGIGEDTYIAMASGGDFTEDFSHEFQMRIDVGEDLLFRVPSTGDVYNKEVAPSKAPYNLPADEEIKEMQEVEGAGVIGVNELAKFLNIPVEKTTKTIIFVDENKNVVAVAVRGDYDIDEEKLKKVLNAKQVELASAEIVKEVTGAEVGYAGILNLPQNVKVIIDDSVIGRVNFECGANRTNYHNINVNFGVNLPEPEQVYDIKVTKEGDLYPPTGEKYEVFKGSEVGNIFPLNTKFSNAFGYKLINSNGEKQDVIMGCYGIGTTRLMGVIVEKYNDDRGIIWPETITPYDYHLITLGDEDNNKAIDLISKIEATGKEVLWDDRIDSSMGEKLADADLIGIPNRVILTKRSLEKGGLEIKKRQNSDSQIVTIENFLASIG
jgi:prolyl-tRNA synthetase